MGIDSKGNRNKSLKIYSHQGKQPSTTALQYSCSEKSHRIYRKTPAMESPFLVFCCMSGPTIFLNIRLRCSCFPVSLPNLSEQNFHRTPPGDCFCTAKTTDRRILKNMESFCCAFLHMLIGMNLETFNSTHHLLGQSFPHDYYHYNLLLQQIQRRIRDPSKYSKEFLGKIVNG